MSNLRVIAGSAKGRRLQLVPGSGTRPIADRVKESLFNILGADVENATVLDLFAGTGGIGIEALSRGATRAFFVESDRLAINTLQANLHHTGFTRQAQVVRSDVFIYLRNQPAANFDYIHIAPPQYKELWIKTLQALDERPTWLKDEGVIVVQLHPREFTTVPLGHFELVDERRYGSTLLAFYEKRLTE